MHRFIIRNTIEEQVYKLFNPERKKISSDETKPTTSKAAKLEELSEPKNNILTVKDVHSLFRTL